MTPAIQDKLLRATGWVVAPKSAGAGGLIDASRRLMLTNYHVVKEENEVKVVFPAFNNKGLIRLKDYYWKNWQKQGIRARVLHRDKGRDLALIQLDSLPGWVRAL